MIVSYKISPSATANKLKNIMTRMIVDFSNYNHSKNTVSTIYIKLYSLINYN